MTHIDRSDRPRVLCVSTDRETRATVTREFADADVVVIVARSLSDAVDRLRDEVIDAVVVDATTVGDVSGFLERLEAEWPGTPSFVHWGDPTVLTEVVDGGFGRDRGRVLPGAVTSRLGSDFDPRLDELVGTAKRRLADATSPIEVERAVREPFLDDDRFGFLWLGEYDRGEREIVPWLSGSTTMEWSMHRTFAIGDGSQPLLERAMQTRELKVLEPIADHLDAVPLGAEAVENGMGSVSVAALSSDDRIYGVLVVYGTEALERAEREAITSVAETASRTLESIAIRGQLGHLQRSLDSYERLVEAASDGMYVLDDEGHFTTVNDGLLEMTGFSREGLLGEHSSLLFGAEGAQRGTEEITRLLKEGGTAVAIGVPLQTKAGATIPVETQVTILVGEGEFEGSVGVVRDVTERKERERQLRRQNERLDAFARIVSHDLRNPLGVSQGYLDLVAETESFEYVEAAREGLDRMEEIIADVLAIAREGEWAEEVEPVSLEDLAREAWENVSTEGAQLEIVDTTTLEVDRSRCLRLLENLLRNAVEHGSRGCGGSESTTDRDSESTTDRDSEATTDRDSEATTGRDSEATTGRDSEATTDRDSEATTDRDSEATTDRDSEATTDRDSEATTDRDSEATDDDGSALTVRVGVLDAVDGSHPEAGFYVEDDGRGMPEEIREVAFDPDVSTSESGLGIGLWVVEEVARGHGWSAAVTESDRGGARFEFRFDQ